MDGVINETISIKSIFIGKLNYDDDDNSNTKRGKLKINLERSCLYIWLMRFQHSSMGLYKEDLVDYRL